MDINSDIKLIKSKIDKQYDFVDFFGYYKGLNIYYFMRSCTIGKKCGLPNFAYVYNQEVIFIKNTYDVYDIMQFASQSL